MNLLDSKTKPAWFWHLTLNTGFSRKSYRHEVSDRAFNLIRGLPTRGDIVKLPFVGYTIWNSVEEKKTGAAFSVQKDEIPLVLCLLALDDEDFHWKLAEDAYLKFASSLSLNFAAPQKPASMPWLAVIVMGLHLDMDAADWLADFERCWAWLLIEDVLI